MHKILFFLLIPLLSSGESLDQFIHALESVESNHVASAIGDYIDVKIHNNAKFRVKDNIWKIENAKPVRNSNRSTTILITSIKKEIRNTTEKNANPALAKRVKKTTEKTQKNTKRKTPNQERKIPNRLKNQKGIITIEIWNGKKKGLELITTTENLMIQSGMREKRKEKEIHLYLTKQEREPTLDLKSNTLYPYGSNRDGEENASHADIQMTLEYFNGITEIQRRKIQDLKLENLDFQESPKSTTEKFLTKQRNVTCSVQIATSLIMQMREIVMESGLQTNQLFYLKDSNIYHRNGQAYGILQIHPIMIRDYNRITKSNLKHSDCFDPEISREIAKKILIHYSKSIEEPNAKHLAFIWNGGGSAWKRVENPRQDKKQIGLEKYFKKVLTALKSST